MVTVQVIDGRLFITDLRAIFFDRNYGPARIMSLLETLRRWPVPNFDAVFQVPRRLMRHNSCHWGAP